MSRIGAAWRALFWSPEPAPEPKRDAPGPTDEQTAKYLHGMGAIGAATMDELAEWERQKPKLPEPTPDFECPDCSAIDFTMGGQTVRVSRKGARPHGEVLTCLGCGGRWYNTGRGLKRPHESALPPAWAMADLQGRAAKAQADAQLERERRLKAAQQTQEKRGPAAGFRVPPGPEQG